MKILTVHNRYKFRGGEDESREAEDTLLADKGHEIGQIVFDNSTINAGNAWKAGLQATWSHSAWVRVRDYIDDWRPDLLDVHNFFPLASPSVYYAARKQGVPVVQTLHNYRLLCPGADFYRNGAVCEDCTRHSIPWPGILHGCYRGSKAQTSAVALMTTSHRLMRTWMRTVAVFFVLSEFAKRKFVENGLPESRMVVKPNFIADPGPPGGGGEEFLYAGRLSPEKGIHTLLQAIALTRSPSMRFRIVGDGPLESAVREASLKDPRITYCGRLPLSGVMRMMSLARMVIVPSDCYETFGRAAAEAFAAGAPVICTSVGAVAEIVDDRETGFHFQAGDPGDLARLLDEISTHPGILAGMRENARGAYQAKYTPERNYRLLMNGYEKALASLPVAGPSPRNHDLLWNRSA
jgi:glycosyltransferase involved in cell wall biosynthesis